MLQCTDTPRQQHQINVRRHLAAQTKEDPWPSPPWLLQLLSTLDVGLFTTWSDSPLEIAAVDFLNELGDVVRELGWDLANLEIWLKAAATHPTFFQLIFKRVFSYCLESNCFVDNNLQLIISILSTFRTRRQYVFRDPRNTPTCVKFTKFWNPAKLITPPLFSWNPTNISVLFWKILTQGIFLLFWRKQNPMQGCIRSATVQR